MLGVGQTLPDFKVVGVKPGFNNHEENGASAFETITKDSFPGKWKVIFFYPKDFTFVCPTEIAEFARLNPQFDERDAVVLGGSTDNEHSKLGWRRAHPDLTSWRSGTSPTTAASSPAPLACSTRRKASPCAPPSWSTRTTSFSTSTSPT